MHPPVPHSLDLPPFPSLHQPFTLFSFVDAAHATDLKTRRSVSGYRFTYGGLVIAFRTKLQTTVTISSAEGELIAAVFLLATKEAKYLRSVLSDLGLSSPVGATNLSRGPRTANQEAAFR